MKITRKNLPKSVVELTVEETVENVTKQRKKAIEFLQKNAEIKGFRKWAEIPEEIIVRQFWEEDINHRAIDYAIDKMYKESLMKEKLVPVAQGQVTEIVSESPLIIKIQVEILPEVEIDDKYKKISLKKKKVEITKEEIENAIKNIEVKFTRFEEDDQKKVEMWDRITIDTDWYDGDKFLEDTSMKDYPLIVGSNILVPWFEKQLIWAKVWDNLNLDITFPKDYHNKNFANKKTIFKTVVKKIERAIKPEFTPEFIEQLRWKKLDFEWFKELIKEELKEVKEANIRLQEEWELIDELLKVTKFEIWDSLLAAQTDKVFEEIKRNMGNDGIRMVDYLESLKLWEEQYKENHVKPLALKRTQWELILHKLQELEKVEVSDDEINTEIEKIITKFQNEDVMKRLKEIYVSGNKHYEELRDRMKYRKLIDSFFKLG